MGSGRFDDMLSKYVKDNYEQSKADLFSVFMDVAINRLAPNGKYGMINMHSWMFLSSFERLRQTLLNNYHIDSLLHLGPRTFDELSGEVVQNAAFVISKASTPTVSCRETNSSHVGNKQFPAGGQNVPKVGTSSPQGADSQSVVSELAVRNVRTNSGTYFRLVDGKNCGDKERMFLDAQANHTAKVYYPNVEQGNFEKIPGSPIGYWASAIQVELFEEMPSVASVADFKQGLTTTDNNKYVRFWQEVSINNIGFGVQNRIEAQNSHHKWFPFNKGGSYRKWYGNLDLIVNFQDDGYEIKEDVKRKYPYLNGNTDFVVKNQQYYFRNGYTWSALSGGNISFRYFPKGIICADKGQGMFCNDNLEYIGALVNSNVAQSFLNIISPTLDYNAGYVSKIPYIDNPHDDITSSVNGSISISKSDWDSHETSWDFEANPLVALCNQYTQDGCGATSYRLENFVKDFEAEWKEKFDQLHQNEEELNRQFIEIYGLQEELTPDVPKDEITILQQGEISIEANELVWHRDVLMKQLLSYAVGCMMGRYSIDKPGLILANQGDGIAQYNELVPNSRFEADDDGIIPLMSAQSDFADNATVRFKQWLAVAFGSEMLVDNLNFIEKCLGKSIDDYFVKDFWKDHKRMYQNRPIYWLFSSKKGAFQCLTYMHRMDAYTAERIRTKYLLPHIEWLIQKQCEMEANAANLNPRERKELDNISKQIEECREYHDRLHVIADKQIAFDLDDGVVVNYAKFGDVLAKIK